MDKQEIRMRVRVGLVGALSIVAAAASPLIAQDVRLTADDYARAERQLSPSTSPLILGGAVSPTWMEDGRFWYRNRFAQGEEILVVDPRTGSRDRAFDHQLMAVGLRDATGTPQSAFALPSRGFVFDGSVAPSRRPVRPRDRPTSFLRMARAPRSSATTTSGSAILRRVTRRDSHPMARTTSGKRRPTRAGFGAIARF
jgi:hypothetical protein